MSRCTQTIIVTIVLVLCGTEVMAQADYGFRFVRVRFETPGMSERGRGWGRGGGAMWAHDYPVAEQNFYIALERTTSIHVEEAVSGARSHGPGNLRTPHSVSLRAWVLADDR